MAEHSRRIVLISFLFVAGVAGASADVDLSTEGPVAWTASYEVHRGGLVWLGGPPDAEALASAKDRGIAVVVDLRGPDEEPEETEEAAREAGLTYHSVPFPRGEPIRADAVQRVAAIVHGAEPGTVLVHCASGQRAAGWWAAHLIADHGVGVDRALDAARGAGLHKDAVAEAVRDFAAREDARRIADEVADQLAGTLMGRLQAAIDEGGVAAGAKVCAEVAQSLTEEVGARHGASVRRTALRLRNPENRPDAFEKAWLVAQQKRVEAGKGAQPKYEVVSTDDGERVLRHLRPILFPGGVCSQCHGPADEIPQDVKTFLEEHYPQDEAVGFEAGDLRGAISVRVPLD